jgi:hypothetical protein
VTAAAGVLAKVSAAAAAAMENRLLISSPLFGTGRARGRYSCATH